MFIFIAIVWFGFRYIKKSLRLRSDASIPDQFLIWSVGCGLFAHAATMISVAYFDQSVMFLYLNLAVIGSIYATAAARAGAAARVPADIPLDGTYARHLP
jgi:hypothetical protein